MIFRELNSIEFNRFINSIQMHSIYQTAEYGTTANDLKKQVIYVGLFNDLGNIIAGSLITIKEINKFKYAYAPRGFLLDYNNKYILEEFTKEIKKYLKRKNIIAIKINPLIIKKITTHDSENKININNIKKNLNDLKYCFLGNNKSFSNYNYNFIYNISLNNSLGNIYNHFAENTKQNIKISNIAGIRIFKSDFRSIDLIIKDNDKKNFKEYLNSLNNNINNNIHIYYAKIDTKLFLINTQKEYQKQIDICNYITNQVFSKQGENNNSLLNRKIIEDNKLNLLKKQLIYATKLLSKYQNGIIIEQLICITHNNNCYLIYNGFDHDYDNFYSNDLLLWKIIEQYKSNNYSNIIIESNFKLDNERYNFDKIEYIGEYELIINTPFYALYKNTLPITKMLSK